MVAMSPPTNIRCKRCSAKHRFDFAWAIAISYVLLLFALMVGAKMFAGLFETKQDNVYLTSPLQAVLELGAPFIALVIGGLLYTWALSRFFELRRHGL